MRLSENRTRPFAKADNESENGVARQLRREDRGAQCARLEKGYVRTDKEAGGEGAPRVGRDDADRRVCRADRWADSVISVDHESVIFFGELQKRMAAVRLRALFLEKR